MQGPVVGEAALELGAENAAAAVEGFHDADDEFGALFVIQTEACAKEEVVFESVGRPSAARVVGPFGIQD